MKKIFLLAATIVALASSCSKKSDNPSSYYIKFKVDGAAKSYTVAVGAARETSGGATGFSVTGGAGTSSANSEAISLGLGTTKPAGIVTGTYNSTETDDYIMLASYILGSNNTSYDVEPGDATPFQIVISSLNDKTVKGTFSGKLYDHVGSSGTKTITDGEFYVKFVD